LAGVTSFYLVAFSTSGRRLRKPPIIDATNGLGKPRGNPVVAVLIAPSA